MSKNLTKPSIFPIAIIVFFIFIVSLLILSAIGLAPKSLLLFDNQPIIENFEERIDIQSDTYTRPDRIKIDKIGIDSIINQPNSADVSVLDQSLLSGAVHYPGSGSIERGNIFVFGHSTNWKVVQNQAYKTFNGLEKLSKGDQIQIEANGNIYLYKVTNVMLVNEDDALVSFDSSRKLLTLSTCNTFGQKQERWVVEAELYQ